MQVYKTVGTTVQYIHPFAVFLLLFSFVINTQLVKISAFWIHGIERFSYQKLQYYEVLVLYQIKVLSSPLTIM